MKPVTRRKESGFALLFVFALSAMVAITLYTQIPRVAFEAQREKEQMLIERGEQYKLAIKRFVRKNQRYPQNMDELEKFNNQRYLRQRYKDPMTGKDEWRLVHINNMGVLTDSKVQTPQGANKQQNQNSFVSEFTAIGQTPVGQTSGVNPAMRRRASEGGGPGGEMQPGAFGQSVPNPFDPSAQPGNPQAQPGQAGQPGQPGQPGQQPPAIDPNTGQPIQNPQQAGLPGQPGGVPGPTGVTGQPGVSGAAGAFGQQGIPRPNFPGMPGLPGAQQGQTGYPNQPANSQTGGVSVMPGLGQSSAPPPPGPGGPQPGQPQPFQPSVGHVPQGMQPGAANNAATGMINDMLRRPNPMGAPMAGAGQGGQQIGGGVAGVASNLDAPSIKIYNERQNFSEWEFIYDMKKDASLAQGGPQGAGGNNPLGGPANPGFGPNRPGGPGGGPPGSGGFGGGPNQPQQPQQPQGGFGSFGRGNRP